MEKNNIQNNEINEKECNLNNFVDDILPILGGLISSLISIGVGVLVHLTSMYINGIILNYYNLNNPDVEGNQANVDMPEAELVGITT